MVSALFLDQRSPSRPPPLAARFAAAGLDRDRRPRIRLGMPSTGQKEPPRQWIAASLMVTKRSRPEIFALDGGPAIRERRNGVRQPTARPGTVDARLDLFAALEIDKAASEVLPGS